MAIIALIDMNMTGVFWNRRMFDGLEKKLAAWLLAGIWLVQLTPGVAFAKVVGIVFDDSGSMSSRFYTPLYALQLLLGSLDESDRIFVVRMSAPTSPVAVPSNLQQRQRYLRRIGRDWSVTKNGGTPVETIYTALERAGRLAKADEQVKLVVITDGDFNEPPNDAGAAIEKHSRRLAGKTVDVAFVAIAPRGSNVLEKIDDQGVRRALLLRFNGDERKGRIDLLSASRFMEQMTDLIAWVNDSDPGSVEAIDYQGNRIAVTPPFPVRQLLVLTQGERGHGAPVLQPPGFGNRGPDIVLAAEMQDRDGLSNTRLQGSVRHLEPWPQWDEGKTYSLDFDRPVNRDNARLMFKTSVRVDWRLYDAQGRQIEPDASGVIRVLAGQPLEARARLYAVQMGAKSREIALKQLPHVPEFTLQTADNAAGAARGSQRMKIDDKGNFATAELSFHSPGKQLLAVRVRYPGFLDLRPGDIKAVVEEDRAVDINLTAKSGADCASCRADDVAITYTSMSGERELLRIQVSIQAPDKGKGRVKLELDQALPDAVWLELPDGKRWMGDGLISHEWMEVETGRPVVLRLKRDQGFQAVGDIKTGLNISAEKPWRGSARLPLRLSPKTAGLKIVARGHTLDPSGKQPFRLKITDVNSGEGMYFSLEGLEGEFNPEYLTVETDDFRAPVRLEPDKGDMFRLIPYAWMYCDCLTAAGTHVFTLRYADPHTRQQVSLQDQFELTPVPLWERCWQETLMLVTVLIALWKLVCLSRSHRFPSDARLLEESKGGFIERRHALTGGWFHRWVWRWVWPWCGSEHRRIRGMHFRAAAYGVELLPDSDRYINYDGDSLGTIFDDNGKSPVRLMWGGALTDGSTTYTVKRLRR